jgi:uncharacterized protein
MTEAKPAVVGVLSDTHGHLYPQVARMLEGVDHIIHAGDIGSPRVLAELKAIAPVTAVRGNCDLEAWAEPLPLRTELEVNGVRILVRHIAGRVGDICDAAVVVTGHTHLAAVEERDGILYVNPGSAGPRRFHRPRTLARLTIRSRVDFEILIADDEA